ncbi:hypothetical protein ACFFJY_10090 [Fictibacillus aquaticus]|uniref:hypothetical protein n=1 Tax=Fictibacillus aquaticus TaxID=2021314 RepID=UPI0013FD17FF|nr:hypothetical protein [Fictibacillus aquaticus]
MGTAEWIIFGGGVLSLIGWVWYYAALGKRISAEEKKAGRDLTYEMNPYTGSAKDSKQE